MDEKNGTLENELQLFHGTKPDSVTSINVQGFNRSLCGINGTYTRQYLVKLLISRDTRRSLEQKNLEFSQQSRIQDLPHTVILCSNATNFPHSMQYTWCFERVKKRLLAFLLVRLLSLPPPPLPHTHTPIHLDYFLIRLSSPRSLLLI